MTKEVLKEKMLITERFEGDEKKVPEKYCIKVHPFRFSKVIDNYTDEYEIIKNEIIDFPINQIEWIWIQIINN